MRGALYDRYGASDVVRLREVPAPRLGRSELLVRVRAAALNPKARKPAYRMEIDFGPLGMRTSSAQLTALYTPEELIGRQVLGVVNFPPRRIAGVQSQVLVLGVADERGAIVLLSTEREAPLGSRVH